MAAEKKQDISSAVNLRSAFTKAAVYSVSTLLWGAVAFGELLTADASSNTVLALATVANAAMAARGFWKGFKGLKELEKQQSASKAESSYNIFNANSP